MCERCPFANINVMFANFLFRSRNFCSSRELDPIDKLASEQEIKLANIKLEASIYSMTISSLDT